MVAWWLATFIEEASAAAIFYPHISVYFYVCYSVCSFVCMCNVHCSFVSSTRFSFLCSSMAFNFSSVLNIRILFSCIVTGTVVFPLHKHFIHRGISYYSRAVCVCCVFSTQQHSKQFFASIFTFLSNIL